MFRIRLVMLLLFSFLAHVERVAGGTEKIANSLVFVVEYEWIVAQLV